MLICAAEWDQSSGRVLPLRDDDSQSLIDGEWRKINTLRHYQVRIALSLLVADHLVREFRTLWFKSVLGSFRITRLVSISTLRHSGNI